ncbi:MAG: hypothetical protein WCY77_10740 [Weeksellaceae bacterium]
MKNRILSFLLLVLPLVTVFAQVPPPPTQGEDAGGPGVPDTPIDQYVFALLLIGITFALYVVLSKRKMAKS